MPRFRLLIEYDGGGFVGWQHQRNGMSVQEAIETAIERLSGQKVRLHAAGRTDAGVHALGQVAHVDLERAWPGDTVRDALNHFLRPHPAAILEAGMVDDGFHARISARRRSYLFRLLERRAPPMVDRGRVWHVGRPLDLAAMQAGARQLVGRHDFTTFRAAECQALSPVKTLDRLAVARVGAEIRIEADARSFLHHQVRNMVGTLKLVGDGKWTPDDVGKALARRHRAAGGPTAPPEGLYLVSVGYLDDGTELSVNQE
ncbi:tRNA pseudouridine38-40 synthase [Stella humosa]|uniref:tRNA pseudouridine synthase A n=1 Tax=Stella humosa TaxID=94 RepID=A0A3N1L4I0_9PROT|nr:tRNA pseudouridine(38-40) synthase TruA [Stella humosa]ROP84315.1 tRNA pseudouridine38-40 synthase [Stella humosa]BBK33829.1 tRNA pseudouridine synthase A [Stella humosa]